MPNFIIVGSQNITYILSGDNFTGAIAFLATNEHTLIKGTCYVCFSLQLNVSNPCLIRLVTVVTYQSVSAKSTAETKSSTLQSSLPAHAVSCAALLAATMYEFPTSLRGFW